MNAMAGRRGRTPKASGDVPADERLRRTIQGHITAEADALADYQRLANSLPDPLVRRLLHFVLQDELLHHELLRRMASTLAGPAEAKAPEEKLPPGPRSEWKPLGDQLAAVRTLILKEGENARVMGDLAAKHTDIQEGLLSALMELMSTDSLKHQHLLEYVLRRLEAQGQTTEDANDLAA